jgi:RNA polymerase sigma factor (sigma-70 family)
MRETGAEHDRVDALFSTHAARLVRLARLLGDEDPEDVVQESFCKLYAARARLEADEAKVVAYLNRIVVNEVRGRQRRRAVARRNAHLLQAEPERDALSVHDDRTAVLQQLARLPQRQRETLVLRYWMDLPLADIAEVMGTRVGTVKSQLSRGLETIAAALLTEVSR